jgi:FemAB-related protein (PEP-CTERM system-associated)
MRQEAIYIAARDATGAIRGVLPLVRLKSALFGVRHVSMPYLNDGGPIGEPGAVRALQEHAVRLTGSRDTRLELRTRATCDDEVRECRKVTVLLGLPQDPDALWSALPSKVRSQIRRPQKAGMSARFGVDQLPAFYDVWSQNMRDLGTPVLPRQFFDAVAREFPGQITVCCIYRDGEPVAAGAGFCFGDECEITWASSLRAHSREAPNMLLYWEFMSHAIGRGMRTFNFGRCTPGEGTHRFKMQWGGESVPLPWLTHGAAQDEGGPGRAARMASAVWQRLPVAVANAIGPAVARQLPWW